MFCVTCWLEVGAQCVILNLLEIREDSAIDRLQLCCFQMTSSAQDDGACAQKSSMFSYTVEKKEKSFHQLKAMFESDYYKSSCSIPSLLVQYINQHRNL